MATSKWNVNNLRKAHTVEELLKIATEVGVPKIVDDYNRDWGTPAQCLDKYENELGGDGFLIRAAIKHEWMVQRICEHIDSQ